MSARKVDPDLFREWYEEGVKVTVIAARFQASITQCKVARKRLGVKPRTNGGRPKGGSYGKPSEQSTGTSHGTG